MNAPLFDVDEESEYSNSDDSTYVAPNFKREETTDESAAVRRSGRETHTVHRYAMVDLRDVAAEAAQLETAVKDLAGLPDPKTLKEMYEAPDSEKFEAAIEDEHASLIKKEVMVEVQELPPGMKAIPTKYVLRRKLNEKGLVDRHKARLVVKGMLQRPGTDYDEDNLYAPTLNAASLRVLLAIATKLSYDLSHLDVKTAFLNAGLKEEIYITLPEGAKNARRADMKWKIFRLLKALYGLKQANKEWNEELDKTLREDCGFTRLTADSCLYIKVSKSGKKIYIAVFVDDLLFANHRKDREELKEIKEIIKSKYEVSDGGEECTFLLGMRIQRDREAGSLTLDQQSYIERLLEKTGMNNCVPVSTPEENGVKLTSMGCVSSHDNNNKETETKLSKTEELNKDRKEKYGSYVGALLYAAVWTRPDIAHAVGELTRFISAPRKAHWDACMRVLRYLKGVPELGLKFQQLQSIHMNNNIQSATHAELNHDHDHGHDQAIQLESYADSNWAGCPETRRSTSGVLLKMSGGAVAWSSRRQKSVTLSSSEAEYVALGDAMKEILWIRHMLKELGEEQIGATLVRCDNATAIRTAYSDSQHSRMKHIDIKHHKIREEVENKSIQIEWIPTSQQQADLFTKGLGKKIFTELRDKMMSVPVVRPCRHSGTHQSLAV